MIILRLSSNYEEYEESLGSMVHKAYHVRTRRYISECGLAFRSDSTHAVTKKRTDRSKICEAESQAMQSIFNLVLYHGNQDRRVAPIIPLRCQISDSVDTGVNMNGKSF